MVLVQVAQTATFLDRVHGTEKALTFVSEYSLSSCGDRTSQRVVMHDPLFGLADYVVGDLMEFSIGSLRQKYFIQFINLFSPPTMLSCCHAELLFYFVISIFFSNFILFSNV